MSDSHALSGAYAVDALDDIERAQFERHLRDCDICASEVESLRDASALLAETTAVAPSAELRARVLAEIATVRPLPPVTTVAEPTADPRPRRWLPALVAAAAAVIAVGAGAIVTQPWDDDSSQVANLTAAERVLAAPDAETFTNTFGGPGKNVTMVRSLSLKSVVIVPEGMPPAPSGHAYALWLQHDNRMVPAGIMDDSGEPVVLTGDAITATGAAVSVEEAGQTPESPSDQVAALFEFDQA
jgi:Anti-sigma-K factor rskA